jgi:hypothetical protein
MQPHNLTTLEAFSLSFFKEHTRENSFQSCSRAVNLPSSHIWCIQSKEMLRCVSYTIHSASSKQNIISIITVKNIYLIPPLLVVWCPTKGQIIASVTMHRHACYPHPYLDTVTHLSFSFPLKLTSLWNSVKHFGKYGNSSQDLYKFPTYISVRPLYLSQTEAYTQHMAHHTIPPRR